MELFKRLKKAVLPTKTVCTLNVRVVVSDEVVVLAEEEYRDFRIWQNRVIKDNNPNFSEVSAEVACKMEDSQTLIGVLIGIPGKTRRTLYKLVPSEVQELKEWVAEKAVR